MSSRSTCHSSNFLHAWHWLSLVAFIQQKCREISDIFTAFLLLSVGVAVIWRLSQDEEDQKKKGKEKTFDLAPRISILWSIFCYKFVWCLARWSIRHVRNSSNLQCLWNSKKKLTCLQGDARCKKFFALFSSLWEIFIVVERPHGKLVPIW